MTPWLEFDLVADAGTAAAVSFVMSLAWVLAWAGDTAFGEPRNALHPVAWLGQALARTGRGLLRLPAAWAWVGGAAAWCAGALVCTLAAVAIQHAVLQAPWWLAAPVLALLLKPTFAWRMLRDEVAAVQTALDDGGGDLTAARQRLARLVSRDVSGLSASDIRETAIETLAENLNDSVVAPLFWLAVAGLPGAVLYRFANTADAMWGYRGRWEWAGKWAAQADDVLSWLPARLTALAVLPPRRWRALPAQARLTPSPNGGWPMGAMALRLGVRLHKPGVYTLNAAALPPQAADVGRALRCANAVAWAAAASVAALFAGRALGGVGA